MPIGEQNPITPHTGNGTATVFAYDFAILSADDIKVKVGGSVVTTGFTVAGIGDRDGGTVTFSVAPGSGVEVLLYREVTRARSTDYQSNGDLREDVLDDDFDRIWMALQEDGELIARGIRVPVGESLSELPAAALRVDKVLTFGTGGAIALVDVAAFAGGGVVELVPADGSITMTKLATAVQNLINGALQKSGGTMTGELLLSGNTANALGAVPKQQVEEMLDEVASNRMQYSQSGIQATTSGSAVDFTAITPTAKRITIAYSGVSLSGGDLLVALLGTSAGLLTSGYQGTYQLQTIAAPSTGSGGNYGLNFALSANFDPSDRRHGIATLVHMGGNLWAISGTSGLGGGGGANTTMFAGSVQLPGVLDRIRFSNNGSSTFDGGSAAIMVEA